MAFRIHRKTISEYQARNKKQSLLKMKLVFPVPQGSFNLSALSVNNLRVVHSIPQEN